MNKEVKNRNWVYKDLGIWGAYITETNGECTKLTDVTHIKRYLEDLIEENQQLQQKVNQLEANIEEALKFIDNNMYERYCYVGSEDKLKEILERGIK